MIDETVEQIEAMRTHSSSVVAVKAARALETVLEREYVTIEEFERDFERNSDALRRASPSHASLWTTQRDIVSSVREYDARSVDDAKRHASETIERIVDEVETAKQRAAERAAERIADGETILTHDYSTTVFAALGSAAESGKALEVFVTEARPRFLGRKSVRELGDIDGIDPHLIVDSAAGYYLTECDRVMVGMDCVVEDKLYNRVGTYPIAATAADRDVPVAVVGSSRKLVDGGFRFENDFRSPNEVMLEPADGFEVHNPAYDATPTALLDAVITDEEVEEY